MKLDTQLEDKEIIDLVIVGAGIVGLSCAYEYLLKNPNHNLVVIEKEGAIFQHQSGRNSGVIHSGIYYKPGSMKAENCIKGYKKLIAFMDQFNIPYELTGKLIVTSESNRIKDLEILKKNGELNGLTGLKILKSNEILKYEPFCTKAIAALHVPQTGIVDYKKIGERLLYEIQKRRAKIFYKTSATNIESQKNKVFLKLGNNKIITAKKVIVASGVQSDLFISKLLKKKYRVIPFKGEYFRIKKNKYVKGLIYPLPDLNFPFLGVHLTKTMKSDIEAGPNAVLSLSRFSYSKLAFNFKDFIKIIFWKGFWIFAFKYWKIGFYELYRSCSKREFLNSINSLVPSIQKNDIEKAHAGIRAQILTKEGKLYDDFLIEKIKNITCIVNAPSPAATSSLSIAESIIRKL